ncbi:hypothetical protein UPYG_G00068970 [Umbra pygmaea]|uniref:Uncharacterized protein n=1 Tax=Umbra pygmaea TaxID=75934 RepID=A0ABD0XSW3_UMBPY
MEDILKVSGLVTSTIAPKTTAAATTDIYFTTVAATTTTAAPTTTMTEATTKNTSSPQTSTATPTTTAVAPTNTAATTTTFLASVATTPRSGTVVVFITLLFNHTTLVPNKDDVLAAVYQELPNKFKSVSETILQNATYMKMSSSSFAIDLAFNITNVKLEQIMNERDELSFTDETFNNIQTTINNLLRILVSQPNGKQFNIPTASFIVVDNAIRADVTYVYNEADINAPSSFLAVILKFSGLLTSTVAPTTTTSTTQHPAPLLTTIFNTTSGEGFPGWALAIIIPCGIAIILIPLWILLACLLCGCCAGIRRRWHRRRSYNVQYTTRNGLF